MLYIRFLNCVIFFIHENIFRLQKIIIRNITLLTRTMNIIYINNYWVIALVIIVSHAGKPGQKKVCNCTLSRSSGNLSGKKTHKDLNYNNYISICIDNYKNMFNEPFSKPMNVQKLR